MQRHPRWLSFYTPGVKKTTILQLKALLTYKNVNSITIMNRSTSGSLGLFMTASDTLADSVRWSGRAGTKLPIIICCVSIAGHLHTGAPLCVLTKGEADACSKEQQQEGLACGIGGGGGVHWAFLIPLCSLCPSLLMKSSAPWRRHWYLHNVHSMERQAPPPIVYGHADGEPISADRSAMYVFMNVNPMNHLDTHGRWCFFSKRDRVNYIELTRDRWVLVMRNKYK